MLHFLVGFSPPPRLAQARLSRSKASAFSGAPAAVNSRKISVTRPWTDELTNQTLRSCSSQEDTVDSRYPIVVT
jgi:hypothetical protein